MTPLLERPSPLEDGVSPASPCPSRPFQRPWIALEGGIVQPGEKLVIIGGGGVGGPAAMLSKKLMPDVNVTAIRKEDTFIVR
jgi:hypothetical protein